MSEKTTLERAREFSVRHRRFPNGAVTPVECLRLMTGFADSITAEKDETIKAQQAEIDKWRLALESLTPGGSEFVNDLDYCMQFLLERRSSDHKRLLKLHKHLKKRNGEILRLRECLTNLVNKVELVSEETRGIFQYAWAHDVKYTGPTYEIEMKAAQQALNTEDK